MYDLSEAKVIYADKLPASSTTLYTVPANTVLIIKSIVYTNDSGFNASITTSASGNALFSLSVENGTTLIQERKLVLTSGDTIVGQSTSARVGMVINGILLKKTSAL